MNEKLMIALRSNAANDYLKEINYTGYLREQELGKIKLPTGKICCKRSAYCGGDGTFYHLCDSWRISSNAICESF